MRLGEDVAAAVAEGLVILAGDFNARTGSAPDWPADSDPSCGPRSSSDCGALNSHGHSLLQLCISAGLVLCNGRFGPNSGAATSFGVLGNGKAVSDYAMVSPELLPHILQLQVLAWHPAVLFTDHATLHLEMSIPSEQPQRGAAEQPPAQPGQAEWQPAPQLRQFLPPRGPEQMAAAVEALTGLCDQLSALADAADAASSVADLDAVSAWFSEAVCSALAAGGLREKRQQRSQTKPNLPRHLRQEFGIRQLRRAARQARTTGDAAQQAAARQQLKRAARKAHRAASRLRGEAHEALMCSDPSAFFRPFNKAAKVMSASPTDTLLTQPQQRAAYSRQQRHRRHRQQPAPAATAQMAASQPAISRRNS